MSISAWIPTKGSSATDAQSTRIFTVSPLHGAVRARDFSGHARQPELLVGVDEDGRVGESLLNVLVDGSLGVLHGASLYYGNPSDSLVLR